ncbi:cupin domain-containing protein [Streptomyces sp. SID3343]|uniref:cupin domain-containing protein n=1 Tax=Streptomyces sp. SID3343 TaxID=2690260 RepID=UPI0013715559|nr:cupin domain-containing protein [Streptomyces sp. SID3343]MYV97695.1 cupin domain-containing protein [Streptomyces sp. SID3343]
MTTDATTPFALLGAFVQLREGGAIDASTKRPGPDDAGLWTMGAFRADSDKAVHADVWECHFGGDEVLYALSGVFHIHLRDDTDAAEPAATLTPGACYLVPQGRWHRLTVAEPGELLSISPRTGTRHEPVSGAVRG